MTQPVGVGSSERVVSLFSPKSTTTTPSLYALVTADHRLKVWDCASKKIVADEASNDHLVQRITSLTWASVKIAKKSSPIVALGMEAGSIRLYHIAQGEVIKTLSSPSISASITALVYDSHNHRLFASSSDGWVSEWDLAEYKCSRRWRADTASVTALAFQKDVLFSAGRTIKMWHLSDDLPTVTRQFTGHATDIRQLLIVSDYLLSLADQDRFINIYSTDKSSTEMQSLVGILSLDSYPVSMDAIFDKGALIVSAVAGDGKIIFFRPSVAPVPTSAGVSKKSRAAALKTIPQGPVSHIEFRDSNSPIAICNAQLLKQSQNHIRVFVAEGAFLSPQFELVDVVNADGEFKDIVIARMADRIGGNKKPVQRQEGKGPAVTDSIHFPISLQNKENGTNNQHDKSDSHKQQQQKTLAEQLQSMEVTSKASTLPIKSNSLVRMLTQSLQSSDRQLLEQCLQTRDALIIQKTIQHLPTQYVVVFLKELIDRFQGKPTRAIALIIWIRAVFTYHTAYLITVPELVKQLAPLYQAMNARMANQAKLARLSGRLDLMMSQITMRKQSHGRATGEDGLELEGGEMVNAANVYYEGKTDQYRMNGLYDDNEEEDSDDGEEEESDDDGDLDENEEEGLYENSDSDDEDESDNENESDDEDDEDSDANGVELDEMEA